jgi:putative PIN family toxin of toxin-antitoxin system
VRVFLDTNVLVSAVATRGLAADVLRVVLTEHTLVTGEVVLVELRGALERKLRMPKASVDELEALLREFDVVSRPAKPAPIDVRDADDAWVIGSASAGGADVLVTGDRDLLDVAESSPVRILDPRAFWELLREVRG